MGRTLEGEQRHAFFHALRTCPEVFRERDTRKECFYLFAWKTPLRLALKKARFHSSYFIGFFAFFYSRVCSLAPSVSQPISHARSTSVQRKNSKTKQSHRRDADGSHAGRSLCPTFPSTEGERVKENPKKRSKNLFSSVGLSRGMIDLYVLKSRPVPAPVLLHAVHLQLLHRRRIVVS
jgi:hypothetical protein